MRACKMDAHDFNRERMSRHLDKGDFKVVMPYTLLFRNRKTNGAFLVGIGSY